jgi:hypothetical protein
MYFERVVFFEGKSRSEIIVESYLLPDSEL